MASKSKQPKAGEWWQYNGVRVYVVGVQLNGHLVVEYRYGAIATLVAGEFWKHLPDCTGFDWKPEPEMVFPCWAVPTEETITEDGDEKEIAYYLLKSSTEGETYCKDGTSFRWITFDLDSTEYACVTQAEAESRIVKSEPIPEIMYDPKTFTSDWGPFPKSAEPDPEEWVDLPQDHLLRAGTDRFLNHVGIYETVVGFQGAIVEKLTSKKAQCRRKHLPPLPTPKPNRIPVRLYWYNGHVVARYDHSPPTDPSFREIKFDPLTGFYAEGTEN